MKDSFKSRFSAVIAMFLPGIFLLGFNIGTGSVTTMAKAGATYGMSLLWTVAISCLATYFMITLYGRYTLITGETALHAFKKHLHPAVGVFFIIALTAGVFITLVYFIFWNGKTQFFERALAVIVAVMAACFILNFFILMPPISSVVNGLVPNVPNVGAGESRGPFLLIASMVGTTLFSGLFIMRTTLIKESGWTLKDDKQQRRDALLATSLMFIISGSIMAAAAGSLFTQGVGLSKASQMIVLLEPFAGAFAASVFAIGIIAAGVSSHFPNIIMLPWLLCDYTNSEREMTLTKYRIMVFVISLLGLVVPLLGARPLVVMIVSQAFNSILLPMTVACIFLLGNKASVMGKHRYTDTTNIILIAIFVFSIVTSIMGIQGVLDMVKDIGTTK